MKLLIYGSKGWIGNQFINYLKEYNLNNLEKIDYIEGLVRIDNTEELKTEILEINPTNIITFIGRTHGKIDNKIYSTIDYLEQEGKLVENIRDNLFSPISLALICKEFDIHYSYLGTGCIFDYDNNHPYGKDINGFTEEDKPNFFGSSYSIVKGFTDRLFHQLDNNCLNMRIRMPITCENNNRNFITKIIKYEKICSIPNSMTVLEEFYPIIIDLLKNKTTGTINLTNPGLISHNEILELYKKYVDKNFKWKNFTIEEQNNILDSKRSNNYLNTLKLKNMFPNINHIKKSVENILKKYKK